MDKIERLVKKQRLFNDDHHHHHSDKKEILEEKNLHASETLEVENKRVIEGSVVGPISAIQNGAYAIKCPSAIDKQYINITKNKTFDLILTSKPNTATCEWIIMKAHDGYYTLRHCVYWLYIAAENSETLTLKDRMDDKACFKVKLEVQGKFSLENKHFTNSFLDFNGEKVVLSHVPKYWQLWLLNTLDPAPDMYRGTCLMYLEPNYPKKDRKYTNVKELERKAQALLSDHATKMIISKADNSEHYNIRFGSSTFFYLTAEGSTTNSKVILMDEPDSSKAQWQFDLVDETYYVIRSSYSGLWISSDSSNKHLILTGNFQYPHCQFTILPFGNGIKVLSVTYSLGESKENTESVALFSEFIENNSTVEATVIWKKTTTIETESSFEEIESVSITTTANASFGIPFIGEGSIEISSSYTHDFTKGFRNTVTEEIGWEHQLVLTPGSKVQAIARIKRSNLEVPYTMVYQEISSEEYFIIKGVWKGACCHELTTAINNVK